MTTREFIRRLRIMAAARRIKLLEAQLAEQRHAAGYAPNPAALGLALYRRNEICKQLATARAEWLSFQAPGVRPAWREA